MTHRNRLESLCFKRWVQWGLPVKKKQKLIKTDEKKFTYMFGMNMISDKLLEY